ncbi:hypothetical protein CDAR_599881 [Caerostris darwini]|uniref:Uncharacterized protein n=1 Tax=Caerostris darwini TaxID=1538125 RepID=A0AAV4RA14_9ARAC|nr:hypothetical protein CDAR_599881 [Caerostris darwini]
MEFLQFETILILALLCFSANNNPLAQHVHHTKHMNTGSPEKGLIKTAAETVRNVVDGAVNGTESVVGNNNIIGNVLNLVGGLVEAENVVSGGDELSKVRTIVSSVENAFGN